tara:strand:- start:45 stop:1352 length:1308 start_codon:yes stop_codon:yes gene_type:complete
MADIDKNNYMSGFGNEFSSEALEGALPEKGNTPQKIKYGLYAEQISGSAFTAPNHSNKRTWLYKMRPSVTHGVFEPFEHDHLKSAPFGSEFTRPNAMRWDPLSTPSKKTDFIDGLWTVAGNGNTDEWSGLAVHLYNCNTSMKETQRYFYNADGELLIVPQKGQITLHTELGILDIAPNEIAVIPRGIKFAVDLKSNAANGYICENYGAPLMLPEKGPIGANGMASPRDFLTPIACFEDVEKPCTLIAKFNGKLFSCALDYSPLDVVAWHGNYVPYKYDLTQFQALNAVNFDHPDPSIFTVLTSPSHIEGTANIDFVVFPPRWVVAENTFRPPYFHRNIMSEFMGLIDGVYEGKTSGGFNPGGSSLHNSMIPHGPDQKTYDDAINEDQKPVYLSGALAFMFESRYIMHPTKQAVESPNLQKDYFKTWDGLSKNFEK